MVAKLLSVNNNSSPSLALLDSFADTIFTVGAIARFTDKKRCFTPSMFYDKTKSPSSNSISTIHHINLAECKRHE